MAGDSLRTLVWLNLAILAGITAMTWRLLADACGRVAAGAASAVLLGVFAFSQYTPIANYNYVTPYHHPQTHALALGLAMILALGRGLRTGRTPPFALAGACLGGALLTKAELALPALLAAATGLALAAPRRRRAAAALGLGALLPLAGFGALLAARMPAPQALEGLLGAFAHLGPALGGDPFYVHVSGLDAPAANLAAMARPLALLLGFAALAAALDRLAAGRRRARAVAAGAGLLAFALLAAWPRPGAWLGLARALPVPAVAGAALALACWRRADPDARARRATLAIFAVWAAALLAKIALHARFEHYGFALAMPASLLLVVGLVGALPGRLRDGRLARAVALGAVAAGVLGCLRLSDAVYARKGLVVGRGGDALVAEVAAASPRPARVKLALERLEALVPASGTLLVMPEGIAFNYWLRRRNPVRFGLFLPTEIAAFGEAAMLAELRAAEPDAVALVHRGHREFGVGPFGADPRWGRGLMAFVEERYEPVERIGPEPFGDEGFGVALWRRRDAPPRGRSGGRAPSRSRRWRRGRTRPPARSAGLGRGSTPAEGPGAAGGARRTNRRPQRRARRAGGSRAGGPAAAPGRRSAAPGRCGSRGRWRRGCSGRGSPAPSRGAPPGSRPARAAGTPRRGRRAR